MGYPFKKRDKVIWRLASSGRVLEYPGVINQAGKYKSHVVFDGSGHWIENDCLTKMGEPDDAISSEG
jgi:hypothetical protein